MLISLISRIYCSEWISLHQILLFQLEGPLKIYECAHDLNQVCLCLKNRIADFVGISYFSFLCVLLLVEKELKIMLSVQDFDLPH